MNYDKEMYKIIEKEGNNIPKVLLHSCCAPCSSHVIDTLTPYFDITILYYNPNIEPYDEYLKRKEEEIKFIKEYNNINKLDIIDCDYDNDKYKEIAKGLEGLSEGGERCFKCYELRMRYTALKAKELNYDYFATTLTVSPYKNSSKLNEIGGLLEKEIGIKYLYSDFKKNNGYKHSIELSKKYNLYRQDYCGCIYSKREHDLKLKLIKKYKVLYEDIKIGTYNIYEEYVEYKVDNKGIKKLNDKGYDLLPMISKDFKGRSFPFFDNRIKNCLRFPDKKISYQTDSIELIEIK